ncbi:hypothetical protein RISK_003074 [Rhodopirellula islandica]|uniref:Uncharacterized protein n=1 Tax=Rhodopirellula islandica TaxID=595434 RepID=A0A0J1BE51_RHOIS|nr:hypothetical protein RISK_003074 [Rhodopirellula islandica]
MSPQGRRAWLHRDANYVEASSIPQDGFRRSLPPPARLIPTGQTIETKMPMIRPVPRPQ